MDFDEIGPEYLFTKLMCENLCLSDYTVKRFLSKSLTREYLLYNFGQLERGIKYALNSCSDGSLASELDPEFVKTNRARYEDEFLSELRKIHEEAMERFLKA